MVDLSQNTATYIAPLITFGSRKRGISLLESLSSISLVDEEILILTVFFLQALYCWTWKSLIYQALLKQWLKTW